MKVTIQPKYYSVANRVQRYDAEEIVKEFSSVLKWRLDGKDSLIDLGTGSGDVLMDFIYPLMPKNFTKLVGTDISSEMVKHCEKNYSQSENVKFKVLDIGTENLPKELIGEFDHVTSFYSIHWVQNQRLAADNVYRLLKSGGDCLLVFLSTHSINETYDIVSLNPKWAPYMKDIKNYYSPLFRSKDPRSEFSKILEDTGFVDVRVEERYKIFDHEDFEEMKNTYRAVNPFLHRVPVEMHEEILDEIIHTAIKIGNKSNNGNIGCIATYKLIVAYARKG
ncbi:juvenile hormone acid O-methyltransferase isoform X1 [Episyrphus balteatus]|uniref:juvenile hormone acid O-methyltransferase isoform X1 n=1 Tax=Episyrphus balteatus TaxID=286459 RepID=UPI0024855946|nr:juvenile hormone acid O-methyltransferase isoform X1 [Episyrphus balteatus]XP_055855258.1 juvenile hormone acid O-methyltransferase isoform X1 [Episyrphus balteatus]